MTTTTRTSLRVPSNKSQSIHKLVYERTCFTAHLQKNPAVPTMCYTVTLHPVRQLMREIIFELTSYHGHGPGHDIRAICTKYVHLLSYMYVSGITTDSCNID